MHDDEPLRCAVVDADGPHRSAARGSAVAWPDVDVQRPEAVRAMVAVAAVRQGIDGCAALRAREAGVLCCSGDRPALRVEGPPTRSAGFGSVLPEGPGLGWTSDWFTAVPLGSAITSGSDFTGACSISGSGPRPAFGKPFVPATVRRASPPPTGRCRSSCTGVGVLPGLLGERSTHDVRHSTSCFDCRQS